MNLSAAHTVSETLGYQDRLPLLWRAAGADDPTRAEIMDEAQRVLMTCSMLEENRRRSEDEGAVEAEIDRLHTKMNLVLEMLGGLLAVHQPRPPPLPLWLSADGVLWLSQDDSIVSGASGFVAIHLHRSLPRPLVLPAPIEHSGGGEIKARFEDLSGACRSELERHVFLRHRRAVAGSRSPPGR
jgi:hypothetical protein